MKKLMLIGAACLAASSAFADLGDTYAQSCAKWSGKGTLDKQNHQIIWHFDHATIVERFVKNECVFMQLFPDKGLVYTVNGVQRILPYNCGPSQVWGPFTSGVESSVAPEAGGIAANWQTTDGLILAALYNDGAVQIAYKWFIEGKGLLTKPAETAPVEDAPVIKQHLNSDGTVPNV
jgi:hypothetical protein